MKNEQSIKDAFIASKESPISGSELLADLKLLFNEFFLGVVAQEGERLIYLMPNGQTWRFTVEEV